jgi:hypothetical protein
MEARLPIQSLFAVLKDRVLKDRDIDLPWTRQFLAGLAALPPDIRGELPFLTDIAALCTGASPPAATAPGREAAAVQDDIQGASASWGPVRRGLNRRYLRIRFVQGELERLDFKKAKPGAAFNDFVFDQIDFSAYKKISREDFTLFSGEGLEDFTVPFFEQAFHLSREKTADLTAGSYTRIGSFYYIKQEKLLSNPLLMAILRTLQTSLTFTPLCIADVVLKECVTVFRFFECRKEAEADALFRLSRGSGRFFTSLLRALHGAALVHADGMRTDLSFVQEENAPILRGAFHPKNKVYTVALAAG